VKTAAFVVWQELTHVPEALTAFTVRAIPWNFGEHLPYYTTSNPEDSHLRTRRRENRKFHLSWSVCQETSYRLCNPRIHQCLDKRPPVESVLCKQRFKFKFSVCFCNTVFCVFLSRFTVLCSLWKKLLIKPSWLGCNMKM
jgi:hypothetical protein